MESTVTDDHAHPQHGRSADDVRSGPAGAAHAHGRFWWHFAQMIAVMIPGMFGSAYIVVAGTGVGTYEQALVRYPTLCLVAMAVGMTLPMVALMAARRMGSRNIVEMSLAMTIPVVPFLCLVWFGVTESAMCGAYCAITVVAMLGLMAFRRDAYSAHA
jgi:hypothetical protein